VQKPREIAVRILLRREQGEDFVENLLEAELATADLSSVDRGLCQELVYGIVRWQRTLDWLIAQKTQSGREQKPAIIILLKLGLYQMFWLTRIPNHAAVHETVELAKQFGLPPEVGFTNAVLRSFIRERVETEALLKKVRNEQPAVGYSHPDWLVERWLKRWDLEKTAKLLELNNTAPPTYVRVNTLKASPAELAKKWEFEGVKFTAPKWDWTGDVVFQLDSHPPLESLRSFQQGLFYVQDPSTLLAVHELEPHPAQTVLDLCAAPGGKTTFIAQLMQNRGKIMAQDNEPERLDLVRENYIRLGITCIETSLAPEGILEKPAFRFDRILVDAPCSNTGVLRRRIDLRWRIRPEEIERLRRVQLQILRQAAPRLKPGGILVYSTCSLEPEENQELINQFLAEHPHFKLDRQRELLPFVEGVDGAYVARLKLVSQS
jgi:16S rRNA (cytosine967-C5)-methyltransferase